jgi:hypothetical protein
MVKGFIQCFDKLFEVLFVKEYFVAFVAVAVKFFLALGDGDKIVTLFGTSHIKKVSPPLACTQFLTKKTTVLPAVIFHAVFV